MVPRRVCRGEERNSGAGKGGSGSEGEEGEESDDSLKRESVKSRVWNSGAWSKKYRTGGPGWEKRKGVGPGRDLPRTRENGYARVSV